MSLAINARRAALAGCVCCCIQIASNMGLEGSANGNTLSVSAEFGRVTGHEENMKVAEVHAMSFSKKSYIERGDINKIAHNDDFKDHFSNLPVFVKDTNRGRRSNVS